MWNDKSIWRWHVLDDLIKKNGWTRGAELGIKDGKTIHYLLKHNPNLQMIGVDAWQKFPDGMETYQTWPMETIEKQAREKLASFGDRVEIRKGLTSETYRGDKLDFVFIDASHDYDSVVRDIEVWRESGGVILGHDIDWPSVEKAVIDCFGRYDLHENHVWSAPL